MKVLFDNGVPWAARKCLQGHVVVSAYRVGWHELTNGELIQKAEDSGFQVFLSTDKNIRYQQNLASRKIASVILGNSQWPIVRLHLDRIVAPVNACTPGSYTEVEIPHE